MADCLEIPKSTPPAETAIRTVPPARLDTALQTAPPVPQVQDVVPGGAAELRRLDEAWQAVQWKYTVLYGKTSKLPNLGNTVASGLFGLFLIGAGCLSLASAVTQLDLQTSQTLALTGVFFILVGIGLPIYHAYRLQQYEQAHREYRQRRSAVLAQLPPLDQ
jgi:hypothetical protein